MTVNSTNIISGPYAGNDVADTFSYTFRITDKTQLIVYENDTGGNQTQLTVDVDYTVNSVGDDTGGTITRIAGSLPTGYTWYIRSDYKETQLSVFSSQSGFFPDVHEDSFDKLTFLVQQLNDSVNRSFRLSDSVDIDGLFSLTQNAATRAGMFLAFDDSGNIILKEFIDAALIDQNDFDKRYTTVLTSVSTMKSVSPADITGKSVTLNPGMLVMTQGYYSPLAGAISPANGSAIYLIKLAVDYTGTPDEYGDHTLSNGNIAVLQNIDMSVNLKAYGAKGDDTNDDTPAIQAAIDKYTAEGGVGLGNTLFLPAGTYKTTATILMKHGVKLVGENLHSPGSKTSASLINGHHNGVSVISFKGAQGCVLEDVGINVAATFSPKTHILMGRATSASAGFHQLTRVFTAAIADSASVYSVASEQNSFRDCVFDLYAGGTALHTLHISQSDDLLVDSLVASSNVLMTFSNVDCKNRVDNSAAVGVYINTGGSTGSITFSGCYGHQAKGNYVQINNGQVDGIPSLGGIQFLNQCGEILDLGTGNSPVNGFEFTGSQPMRGLTILGGRMSQLGGVSPNTIKTVNAMEDCIIDLPENKTSTNSSGTLIGSALSTLTRTLINHVTVTLDKIFYFQKDAFFGKTTNDVSTDGIVLRGTAGMSASRTSAQVLDTNLNGSDGVIAYWRKANTIVGNISVTGAATAYNTTSDKELKDKIEKLTKQKAYEMLNLIDACLFHFKAEKVNGEYSSPKVPGFLAQEIYSHEVLRHITTGTPDDWEPVVNNKNEVVYDDNGDVVLERRMMSIDQSKFTPILWAVSKGFISDLEALTKRLETLESTIK